ncbi:substrate-binding domain-containing protein [Anaerocolumna sp.]|uniref:substrate-binding domain-containing protein n=1 Tax=Anaerocolumna sp. TaxID=2041569 RepID=UPI0028ADAE90|nr:substrate-binding domain-containing protein [Anaerocolumna sp.]
MQNKKKIALFISHIFGEYQRNLCTGIITKAMEYGYHVDIFTSNDGETTEELGQGESSILKIPNYSSYRGVIFASGTYIESGLKNRILQTIKENCSCPILNINQEPSEFYTLSIDNIQPMKELVSHLITAHKYQRISFLANKHDELVSLQRIQSYQETMNDYNLSWSNNTIAWCYPNLDSVREAVTALLSNPEGQPEVIVCYNDKIALMVFKVLTEKGFKIPNDIALTGYDNLAAARHNIPPITSVEFPVKELGELAMDTLIRIHGGEKPDPVITISAHPVILSSCGCVNPSIQQNSHYNLTLIDTIARREREMITDINLSSSLLNITDIDEGMDVLAAFTDTIEDLEGFYICLYPDWDSLSNSILNITDSDDETGYSNDLKLLKMGIKNGKRIPECSFSNNILLPASVYHSSSIAFLYMPLYFKDRNFGYIALSYKNHNIQHTFSIMLWLRNINNMLQTIISNYERTALINRLETLYLKDELTHLWNMKGLKKYCESLIIESNGSDKPIMVITLHIDCLEQIQTQFGLKEAELCILVLARAIESNLTATHFCSRSEKNTFHLLLKDATEEDAIVLTKKIIKYLQNYQIIHKKAYSMSIRYSSHSYVSDKLYTLFEE